MNPDDPRISTSARQVQPFLAMEIFERSQELERQGIDIVHLEVGEPDFSVPACVDEAISKAVEGGHTHYTHSLGRYDLREEVAAYYKRRYGVNIDAGRVLVTGGTGLASRDVTVPAPSSQSPAAPNCPSWAMSAPKNGRP